MDVTGIASLGRIEAELRRALPAPPIAPGDSGRGGGYSSMLSALWRALFRRRQPPAEIRRPQVP